MSAHKGWDGGAKDRCWSCDAPDPVEHHCDHGHTVWACEDECAITKETRRGTGVVSLTWDDCPECQHWLGVEMDAATKRSGRCGHRAPCMRCER